MVDKAAVAEAIGIDALMRQATAKAEKASKLSPVFLKRDSFAGTAVSTGSLCLDYIMGGGVPPGRIVGISGPERAGKTLLVTQILFNQVSKKGFAKLHDAEGSTDPLFLQARNINFDKFRGKRDKNGDLKNGEVDYFDMYQPTTVEQLAEYIHTISSILPENRNPASPVCIHALDSVVALITDALDDDIDANKMAYHARMYAQYLPIINSDLVKSGCTLLYTNQLRQKPGVTYGCLQGDSPINFVDGRVHSIREVVENKIEGEVWSYADGEIKPAKITDWFDNGISDASDWVRITAEGPGADNDIYSIIVTKNHKILRYAKDQPEDWVEAKDLKLGDELVSKYTETIDEGSVAEGVSQHVLPVKITKIKEGLGHRYNRKYDLGVEGHHNYLAGHKKGGLIVHNSPLYEPAGDALKFFSSIRLMLTTTKPKLNEEDHPFLNTEMIPGVAVKAGGVWEEPHVNEQNEIIGTDKYMYTGIKTVKNKVFTPYKSCWIRIQFEENGYTGSGLDPVFDSFTFLHDMGYIVPNTVLQKNGKLKKEKGVYAVNAMNGFDLEKEFGLSKSFDYYEYKKWVQSIPELTELLRQRLLVSGLVFERDKDEIPLKVAIPEDINEDTMDAIVEEQTISESVVGLEEVKKRGRPKK